MLVLVCFRRWRLLFCFFLFSFFLRFFIFRIFFHIFSTRIANPLAGYIACTPASTNAAWTFTFGIGTFTGAFFWIHFLKNYKIYVLENGYRCIMNFSNHISSFQRKYLIDVSMKFTLMIIVSNDIAPINLT